ncbi:MAG: GAF domain-containing protein [Anaerolineales bacterium]
MQQHVYDHLVHLSTLTDLPMPQFRDAIIEAMCDITASEVAYFYASDLDGEHLTLLGYSKSVMQACQIVDKPAVYHVTETGMWGDAVRERQAIITNNYATTSRPSKRGTPEGHVPLIRHMNTPIFEGDSIVAVVGVANKPTDYTAEDVENLQDLMANIWMEFRDALWAAIW